MEELLRKLNITETGKHDGNKYIVELPSYARFNKVFQKLDSADFLEENTELAKIDFDETKVVFENEEYEVTLTSNLNEETYTLIVERK